MIEIYDRVAVSNYFDEYPSQSLTVYVPASGSWCETFDNKEQYLKRMDAWDRAVTGDRSGPQWYDLRGSVSHPMWNVNVKDKDILI